MYVLANNYTSGVLVDVRNDMLNLRLGLTRVRRDASPVDLVRGYLLGDGRYS